MESQTHCTLVLEVEKADLAAFDALFDRLAAQGVTFPTLAQEQAQTPDWLTRFTESDNATRLGNVGAPRTVEQMPERLAFLTDDFNALILAKSGEKYLGYTLLNPDEKDAACLRQGWTGVHPDFRRQGVATALKVLGIRYAREKGFRYIVTEPRIANVASVQMSLKVGFRPSESEV